MLMKGMDGMVLAQKKERIVNRVILLDINEIKTNPAQPRTNFMPEQLQVLANSIKENGLLQPITVRKNFKGWYELISGERRLRACAMLGNQQIPCIIVDKSERESAVLSLIENIHREDLDIFEQASALKKLIAEWNVTQEEAALKLGMAQSTVANKMRLLKLTEEEQYLILKNKLTERHARALLKIDDDNKRKEIIDVIAKKGLTVAQTDKYISELLTNSRETVPREQHGQHTVPIIKDVRVFVNSINKAIRAMKEAGIPALAKRREEREYIEYIVRIPTNKG